MKHFMTLMALVVAVTAGAQTDEELVFPFNPDSDNDGMITVEDLFSLLAAFGEEWNLPDYTEWATGAIFNLLDFQAELEASQDSLSDAWLELSLAQSNIDASIDSLASVEDSLQMVTDFNTFISTASRCYISIPDYNYVSSHVHFDITHDCGSVEVRTDYGQNWSAASTRAHIRLPQQGLFVGQRIFVRMSADYSDGPVQEVKHYHNNEWEVLTTIQEDNGAGPANFDSPLSNKTFSWNGDSWTVVGSGSHIDSSTE